MNVDLSSSWVKEVFYFGEDNILRVVTKKGRVYEYPNVSLDVWVDLVAEHDAGRSVGKFLHKRVLKTPILKWDQEM